MGKTLLTVGMTVLSLSIPTDRADARAFGNPMGVRAGAHHASVSGRVVNRFSFTWKRAGISNGSRNRIHGQNRIHNQNRVYQQNGGTKQTSGTSNLPTFDSIRSGVASEILIAYPDRGVLIGPVFGQAEFSSAGIDDLRWREIATCCPGVGAHYGVPFYVETALRNVRYWYNQRFTCEFARWPQPSANDKALLEWPRGGRRTW